MCWTVFTHALKCIAVPTEIEYEDKPHKLFSE
jgi:hypothetical protein